MSYKCYNKNKELFSLHIPKTAGTSFRYALGNWYCSGRQVVNIENRPNLQIKARSFIEKGLPQILFRERLFLHYKNHLYKNVPNIVYDIKFLKYFFKSRICIHGHFSEFEDGINMFDLYPTAEQFICFLRDPLEQHLSMYHYHQKMSSLGGVMYRGKKVGAKSNLDVDEWLENVPSNMLLFFPFNFNKVSFVDVFSKYFVHIGISEEMDKSLSILSEKLGVNNVSIPNLNVSRRTSLHSKKSELIFRDKHKLEFEMYEYAKSLNNL